MTGWITNHHSGSAITVEFPAHPSPSWLTSRTPPAIISAFGGAYDTVERHNPLLRVDNPVTRGSTVTISGWTFDPDNRAKSIGIYIYNGRTQLAHVSTNRSRPVINGIYHLSGRHGYSVAFAATNGTHTYCVQANNISYGNLSPRICRTTAVNGDPLGSFEGATTQPGSVTLSGWAFDRDDTSASSSVQVREGSVVIGTYVANGPRPDVNSRYHITGSHGFTVTFAATAGPHTYAVYAVNLGSAKAHAFVELGTRTVTVEAVPAAKAATPSSTP